MPKTKKVIKKKATHRMPDGTIMSGAKHTSYSKVIKKGYMPKIKILKKKK